MQLLLILALSSSFGPVVQEDAQRDAGLPAPVSDYDYYDLGAPRAEKVELGRLLFFDKVLSGNQNISCATCHHPDFATSDGLALPLGEGPHGLGPKRRAGRNPDEAIHERVPRNSTALFNLGAKEYTRMFHDGRVEVDEEGFYASGFVSPARWKLPEGLDNVLAAQAMFPVTSPTEMAGQQGENDVANARALSNVGGESGVWDLLGARLRAIPEYVQLFAAAYPNEVRGPGDVTYVRAANAIAAFESTAFRSDDSPFDRHLRGEESLEGDARAGMELFYGKASCSSCHSGAFQTDHDFHAIAMPQVGPGKSDGWNANYWRATGVRAFPEDHGRGRVTAREEDRYAFRTPSLRNVTATGPWGHAGAYEELEDVVRHHLDPVRALESYRPSPELLPEVDAALETVARGDRLGHRWLEGNRLDAFFRRDSWVQSDPELRAEIAAANELAPVELSGREVRQLVAFLEALTDEESLDLAHLVPERVPSGLPVED